MLLVKHFASQSIDPQQRRMSIKNILGELSGPNTFAVVELKMTT